MTKVLKQVKPTPTIKTNHLGMGEEEFRETILKSHVPTVVSWILRLVPEIWEWAEEVEEEEAIAA